MNGNDIRSLVTRRRGALAGLALGIVALAGAGFAIANADDMRPHGPGFFGGMGGFGPKAFGKRFAILDEVGATEDQKRKIEAIFEKAREDIRAERPEPGTLRDQMVTLLKQPTIDVKAVETARAGQIAGMDVASKTMSNAFVAAADVLTPDQRAKLADEIQSHGP